MSESQNKMIWHHLLGGFQITQADALGLFKCWRLAARIDDLRDFIKHSDAHKDMTILTHTIKSGKKRYASYELVRKEVDDEKV